MRNITFDSLDVLTRALTPRRYDSVSGGKYAHPNQWSKHLAETISSAFSLSLLGQVPDTGQVNVILTALKLYRLEMPYYYVGPDYLRAVINTRIPGDIQFGELRWPCDGVTFGLPVDVIREHTGLNVDIPFVSGSLYPHAQIVDPAIFPGIESVSFGVPQIQVDRPRLTIVFSDFRDKLINSLISASYGSSYHLETPISQIQEMPHNLWTVCPELDVKLNLTREQESEVNRKMCLLFVKLLIHLACDEPRYVEPAKPTKPLHPNAKSPRPVFWHVPFLGRAYRLPQTPEGTHASPGSHLRRRHVVRQAIGPRDKMLSVAQLPRTPEGKTDWDKVTDAMKQAFWACHKEVIVDDLIVKADGRKDNQQPAGGSVSPG